MTAIAPACRHCISYRQKLLANGLPEFKHTGDALSPENLASAFLDPTNGADCFATIVRKITFAYLGCTSIHGMLHNFMRYGAEHLSAEDINLVVFYSLECGMQICDDISLHGGYAPNVVSPAITAPEWMITISEEPVFARFINQLMTTHDDYDWQSVKIPRSATGILWHKVLQRKLLTAAADESRVYVFEALAARDCTMMLSQMIPTFLSHPESTVTAVLGEINLTNKPPLAATMQLCLDNRTPDDVIAVLIHAINAAYAPQDVYDLAMLIPEFDDPADVLSRKEMFRYIVDFVGRYIMQVPHCVLHRYCPAFSVHLSEELHAELRARQLAASNADVRSIRAAVVGEIYARICKQIDDSTGSVAEHEYLRERMTTMSAILSGCFTRVKYALVCCVLIIHKNRARDEVCRDIIRKFTEKCTGFGMRSLVRLAIKCRYDDDVICELIAAAATLMQTTGYNWGMINGSSYANMSGKIICAAIEAERKAHEGVGYSICCEALDGHIDAMTKNADATDIEQRKAELACWITNLRRLKGRYQLLLSDERARARAASNDERARARAARDAERLRARVARDAERVLALSRK